MTLPWQPSEAAKAIAELMRRDPRGWEVDRFQTYHPGANIGVWTANGPSSASFWYGGRGDNYNGHGRLADRRYVYKALRYLNDEPGIIASIQKFLTEKDQTK